MTSTDSNLAVGIKQVLYGPFGSGKTASICTLLKYWDEIQITPIVLAHDPNALATLKNVCRLHNLDFSRIIYEYFPESNSDWDAIESYMRKVASLEYKAITTMPYADSKRELSIPYLTFLQKMRNFYIDGVPITNLDPLKYWIFHDGLSHIARMAKEVSVGAKPCLHEGEWAVAQNAAVTLIKPFVAGRCNYTLIAHEAVKTNELTGMSQTTMDAVAGRNVTQIISLGIGEVAHTAFNNGKYVWQFNAAAPFCRTRTGFFPPPGAEVIADFGHYLKHLREYIKTGETPLPIQETLPSTEI